MNPLTLVVGIGVSSFLLLYLLSFLDDKHELLKFLMVMSVLAMLLLFPKIFGEAETMCDPVIANTTVDGNLTSYGYTSFCYTEESTTTSTFMRIIYGTYYLIIGYLIVHIFIKALSSLWNMRGGKQ